MRFIFCVNVVCMHDEARKPFKRVCKKELKLKAADWQEGQTCFTKIMQAKASAVLRALADSVFIAYSLRTDKLKECELK